VFFFFFLQNSILIDSIVTKMKQLKRAQKKRKGSCGPELLPSGP